VSEAPLSYENPRKWMKWYFERNEASYRHPPEGEEVNWKNPLARIGSIVFRPVKDAIVCFAVDENSLATGFLSRGGHLLRQAVGFFGTAPDRDGSRLDRPTFAIVSRLGRVLSPDDFPAQWPVPFEAFRRYVEGEGGSPDEQNIAAILWALLGVFDELPAEYGAARELRLRVHAELRREMALGRILWGLARDPGDPQWAEYEAVLARWLNPILETGGVASNFQDHVAALMVLVWCRYHLKKLDRETVLGTYFGETLSVPVPVG
jgi:hypothetical protein